MSAPRVLIAGIGNIFLGDDGFGVAVMQRMAGHPWPEGVRAVDFGIRGFDLAYALMDDYDLTIMVDAVPRGEAPGTLYVIEPNVDAPGGPLSAGIDTHAMNPLRVLHLVKTLGGRPRRVLVVGCEPATFGPENEGYMGLSPPVEAAVDAAVQLVQSLVANAGGAGPTESTGAPAPAHESTGMLAIAEEAI